MSRTLALFALLVAPLAAQNAAPSLQNLLSNSPFGINAPAGQAAPTGPLEFRGTFVDRGERFFSLADPATKKAEWVTLNESGHAFVVKSYDTDSETVTVDFQGRSLSLKLRTAKVTAMAMPTPAVVPPPGQGANPNQPPPPNVTPASATEAQRLAQVAEEIRRRRALRQQATQTPPAPTNSAPPPSR